MFFQISARILAMLLEEDRVYALVFGRLTRAARDVARRVLGGLVHDRPGHGVRRFPPRLLADGSASLTYLAFRGHTSLADWLLRGMSAEMREQRGLPWQRRLLGPVSAAISSGRTEFVAWALDHKLVEHTTLACSLAAENGDLPLLKRLRSCDFPWHRDRVWCQAVRLARSDIQAWVAGEPPAPNDTNLPCSCRNAGCGPAAGGPQVVEAGADAAQAGLLDLPACALSALDALGCPRGNLLLSWNSVAVWSWADTRLTASNGLGFKELWKHLPGHWHYELIVIGNRPLAKSARESRRRLLVRSAFLDCFKRLHTPVYVGDTRAAMSVYNMAVSYGIKVFAFLYVTD